ncbi:MAG: fragile histidine triad protein [Piptocephalis tieghemiana]|nr:MAG: fragile histidine triad protein [Piptocephalis tieghemiana]
MTTYIFGPHRIRSTEVFFKSALSLGIVNLKPIAPGHSLILPRRLALRFADLTPEEVSDLFLSAQRVGSVLERVYQGEALTMVVQDGAAAGQTVPHVHVHLIPRRPEDWANNDDIYEALNDKVQKAGVDAEERVARPLDVMAKEARELRVHFPECTFDDEE